MLAKYVKVLIATIERLNCRGGPECPPGIWELDFFNTNEIKKKSYIPKATGFHGQAME